MGRIYRLSSAPDTAEWVVKLAFSNRPASVASLRREILALEALRHPRIVRLHDHGLVGRLPWYAMDFHPGGTLEELTRRAFHAYSGALLPRVETRESLSQWRVPEPPPARSPGEGARPPAAAGQAGRIAQLFSELCEAVQLVHARGWVHGDLKPSNVLVAEGGPLLIDFGQASEVGRAQTDPSAGTLQYCAPERVLGSPPSRSADLYSLGAVLYAMLTGRGPFDGASPTSRLAAEALPASHWVCGVPSALESALGRLLGRDPESRPSALRDVRAILDAWAHDAGEAQGAP